jgi:osmotically-inducible protein OsmY
MKKLLTLIALGSASLVSADQYGQPYGSGSGCPSCNNGGGYYQDQPNNGNYYQQNQRQNPQGYDQRDDRNYQRNNQNDYQQRGNQSYDRDQQRNYDNNYGSQKDGNQRTGSDQEIRRRIHETLSSGWLSKSFQDVSFDVNNGNVNLKGSVDSLENKNKIEENVKKIDGVRQVNNQITIVKESPGTYSEAQLQNSEKKYPQDFASNSQDRQLNAKIRDKLSNGWFSKDYETLAIKTTNGVVIISGTVDKSEDIQKIIDQVKDIDGVISVNNQLTVKNR